MKPRLPIPTQHENPISTQGQEDPTMTIPINGGGYHCDTHPVNNEMLMMFQLNWHDCSFAT